MMLKIKDFRALSDSTCIDDALGRMERPDQWRRLSRIGAAIRSATNRAGVIRPASGLDAAPKLEQDAVAASSGVYVMAVSLKVNGTVHSVTAEPDTPLLYVLRNDLGLNAAKFGCGLGQCGACTVLVDGAPLRSCVTPIGALGQLEITTVEGLGTVERPHPLQAAFVAEQAMQCGYCIPGAIMLAKALLDRNSQPGEAEVRLALAGNLCRCGAHNRIVRAVLRAAQAGGRI
jgi:nicotinate dehydrogenase subunit A